MIRKGNDMKDLKDMVDMIDINKLQKGDTVLCEKVRYTDCGVKYIAGVVTGISRKHNTVTCNIGDYATWYHISLSEIRPYFVKGFDPSGYLKDEYLTDGRYNGK